MTASLVAVSHDTHIPYVEFQGQAVVTFSMVDKVHCRPDDHASRTFRQNRKHFVEGEDFYLIEFSQKGEFHRYGISVPPRGLIVLTESGYLLLVKSFTDDLAWQVQKQLIKVYFRANAQVAPAAAPPIPVLYEKITREQVAELTQGVNRAFYASIFGEEGPKWGHNTLRVTFNLRTLADLPATDFERARETVAWIAQAADAFTTSFHEVREKFYRALGNGAPWTPAVLRKMTQEAIAALPPRPDWLAIQQQLKLEASPA